MIIKDLHIDGFGVWSDLELGDLDAGLTLLYGENETGKTTLLEFVRSMLYGFNDERRAKYLPPVRGGVGGGQLGVETHAGNFRVRRRAEGDSAVGRLDVLSYTGTAQDVRQLKKILADLDESTFKNVFALGLSEIQELGTLSGSGAAEFLYDLAVGAGGVSLTEVQRELEKSRTRLLSSERNSQIGQFLDRRTKLLAEIEQLRQIGRAYTLLADERERLADDVRRCEVEAEELRHTAELHEAAISVYEHWHLRVEVADKLAAIGELAPIPEDAFAKLSQLRTRYRELRPTVDKLKQERIAVRKQAANLPLNKVLWQQGPRIEVLSAQVGWIEQLEMEIRKLESEAPAAPAVPARRESLSGELVKLGLTPSSAEKLSDRRLLKNLFRHHRERREADKRLEQAAKDEAHGRELREQQAAAEAKIAAPARREANSYDEQAQLVANLRKRVQLDQKIEQLNGHREESQRRLRDLLAVSKMPADIVLNRNTGFVVGCLLFFTGFIIKDGVLGLPSWVLMIIGLPLALMCLGSKVLRDLAANEQLDALRSQSRSLETQLHELEAERNELDTVLPPGAGPMLMRLQNAERELGTMEEHVVGETRRTTVHDDLETVRVEFRTAQELADKAARRWQRELEQAGLPVQITWEQLRAASRSRGKHDLQRRKVERRVQYLERRRSELALIADRVAQAFAEAKLEPQGERVSDQMRHLHAEWHRNEEQLERRKALRAEFRGVDRRLDAVRKELHTLVRRRKHLLKSLGVPNEKALVRRRDRLHELAELRRQHEALTREITAALGQRGSEELRSRLENFELPQLEQRWTELCDRLTAIEKRLKELYAEQGRLEERLTATAADKTLPRKLYELKSVERSIGDALARWETLTVTQRLVEAVRKKYEAERQPETLREASRYFERLTEGKYRRVWTPLEAGVLFVDTKDGEKISVEVLSRGTHKQLFLALRLALVDLYARRGKVMPLVLDDVLVNFDTRRTRIAAELLCDYATDHRQLLLFTCHDHIYHLFKTLRAELRLLPGQTISDEAIDVRIVEKRVEVPRIVEKRVEVEKLVEVPKIVEVEKIVERIVEKIVKVKEPVYMTTPAPEPPPPLATPWLDGLNVFHSMPRALPPPPAPPPKAKEPEYEDVEEEIVVKAQPTTIFHKKRVGYPIVPLWSPATPFAEASWQDPIEDDDHEKDEKASYAGSIHGSNGNGNGASNGTNGTHGRPTRESRTPPPPAVVRPRYTWAEEEAEDDDRPETE